MIASAKVVTFRVTSKCFGYFFSIIFFLPFFKHARTARQMKDNIRGQSLLLADSQRLAVEKDRTKSG
mgnify:CR=1 FL=1